MNAGWKWFSNYTGQRKMMRYFVEHENGISRILGDMNVKQYILISLKLCPKLVFLHGEKLMVSGKLTLIHYCAIEYHFPPNYCPCLAVLFTQ